MQRLKGRLNTDTSPQNFWTTFLANDLTEKFKKSAAASAIAILLPLCFSCFVPLRRFRENLTKPFYFYLSRTCDSPGGTPPVISLALRDLRKFSEYAFSPKKYGKNLLHSQMPIHPLKKFIRYSLYYRQRYFKCFWVACLCLRQNWNNMKPEKKMLRLMKFEFDRARSK